MYIYMQKAHFLLSFKTLREQSDFWTDTVLFPSIFDKMLVFYRTLEGRVERYLGERCLGDV